MTDILDNLTHDQLFEVIRRSGGSEHKTSPETQKAIDNIYETIKEIKENHLSHLQQNYDELHTIFSSNAKETTAENYSIKIGMENLKSDIKWVKVIGGFLIVQGLGIITTMIFK